MIEQQPPLIIVNPAAGGGRARAFWRRCAEACAGIPFEMVETKRRGDAANYAADAIDRLARDPQLRRKFGRAGRELVEQNFSSKRIGRDVIALYQRLLAQTA